MNKYFLPFIGKCPDAGSGHLRLTARGGEQPGIGPASICARLALSSGIRYPLSAIAMTSDIFSRMPPEVADQLFTHLHDNERALYKATIDTLSKQRKLRPVFVERKPREERVAWLRDVLSRKQNESVGAQLLQIWFVG